MNRFDQIIGVEGYNEDGQELAASLDVLYKDYESALSEVLEAQWMQDYLQEDEMLSIAVVQTEEKQGAEILDYVKNCTGKQKNTYCYCSVFRICFRSTCFGIVLRKVSVV